MNRREKEGLVLLGAHHAQGRHIRHATTIPHNAQTKSMIFMNPHLEKNMRGLKRPTAGITARVGWHAARTKKKQAQRVAQAKKAFQTRFFSCLTTQVPDETILSPHAGCETFLCVGRLAQPQPA